MANHRQEDKRTGPLDKLPKKDQIQPKDIGALVREGSKNDPNTKGTRRFAS